MMIIRQYQSADWEEVWALHNLALQAAGAHGGNGPWDDDLHQIEAVYLENGGDFLVAIREGKIVAMGALKRISDTHAELKRLRVDPQYQRQGLGQAMLSAREKRARELGYQVLHLDTTTKQIAAQRLFLKNGYQLTHQKTVGAFEVMFFEKHL